MTPVDKAMNAFRDRRNAEDQFVRLELAEAILDHALTKEEREELWQRQDDYEEMIAARDPELFGYEEQA